MRGGARPGAGRKKTGRHTVNLWLTNEEENYLREQLEKFRSNSTTSHSASFETVMESKGQTILPELINTSIPPLTADLSTNDWQQTFRQKIDIALKKSKKQAAEALAAILCDTLNEQILNCLDESITVKLNYVTSFIPKVTDARKKKSSDNILDDFMFEHGYCKTPDEAANRQLWHKNDFLYNLISDK